MIRLTHIRYLIFGNIYKKCLYVNLKKKIQGDTIITIEI